MEDLSECGSCEQEHSNGRSQHPRPRLELVRSPERSGNGRSAPKCAAIFNDLGHCGGLVRLRHPCFHGQVQHGLHIEQHRQPPEVHV